MGVDKTWLDEWRRGMARADLADRLQDLRGGDYCCLEDALVGFDPVPFGSAEDVGHISASDMDICRSDRCFNRPCMRAGRD